MPFFFNVLKEVDDDDDDDDEEDEEDLFLFDSLLSLLTGIDFGFLYLFTVPNLPNFASVIKSFGCVHPAMPS